MTWFPHRISLLQPSLWSASTSTRYRRVARSQSWPLSSQSSFHRCTSMRHFWTLSAPPPWFSVGARIARSHSFSWLPIPPAGHIDVPCMRSRPPASRWSASQWPCWSARWCGGSHPWTLVWSKPSNSSGSGHALKASASHPRSHIELSSQMRRSRPSPPRIAERGLYRAARISEVGCHISPWTLWVSA